ncbi:MAG: HAD family hydrolase [Spirochaetales bacterium]|nr:HAD family hydrolase [Spirochaetales bacterium]
MERPGGNRDTYLQLIRTRSPRLEPKDAGETFRAMTGRKTGGFDAVLFDIYGTLFISASGDISLAKDQHGSSGNTAALEQHLDLPEGSLPAAFLEEVNAEHKRLAASGIPFPEVRVEELWARILTHELDDHRFLCESAALEYELAVNPVYPMPGLMELLDNLREKGIPMGIVSNAQFFTPLLFPAFLSADMNTLGFHEDLSFYSYESRRAKPDTFMYEQAASALKQRGIQAHRTLFVGNDMLNDILPAHKTGFATALFAGDKRSLRWRREDPRVGSAVPDWVITHLLDIQDLVQV